MDGFLGTNACLCQKSMKILHIGKYYPPFSGGMENFLYDMIRVQVASGLTVAALVHHHDPAVRCMVREQICGAVIWRVPCSGTLVHAPVSPGFPGAVKRMIREFEPDVIHAHLPDTSAFWLLRDKQACRIPLVVHWHADVVSSRIDLRLTLAYPFYRVFEKKLLDQARAVIATSRPYLAASRPLSQVRRKTHVIPLGLDPGLPDVSDADMAWARAADRLGWKAKYDTRDVARMMVEAQMACSRDITP
jgi:glycosyltransferase involved in cell wall biosynthesis